MSKLAVIPFSGFYNTWHDQMLEDEFSQMFSDDQGTVNDKLYELALDACNWRKVHEAYARDYAETFGQMCELPSLKFDELNSPREYNFLTDRIFVTLTQKDINGAWKRIDKELFSRICKEMFTSRSGFSSFYDPDYKSWGPIRDWDPNQLGALMHALADHHGWDQLEAMESTRDNGYFDNWIYEAISEPVRSRVFKIHNYLREREERKYRGTA